jgi:hypothetical protein
MINDVYYVLCLEKNLLMISSILKHSPHLDINFSNNRCFIVDKNRIKMVAMGVEERGLFRLIIVENAGLV